MAINVRLSPAVDSLARAYCVRVGISVNSLIGVAVDAYLQRNAQSVLSEPPERPTVPPIQPSAPQAMPARQNAPVAVPDPKPVLPASPTKRDRQRLAEWYQRQGGAL